MGRLSLANSPYHHYMEEDENFRRWVEALELGSHQTRLQIRLQSHEVDG